MRGSDALPHGRRWGGRGSIDYHLEFPRDCRWRLAAVGRVGRGTMHVADSVPGVEGILESLTPAQREAVCHRDGPLLILAGPGSGKTRVVTHRIAFLLSQCIPARQIVALTFTNKAAEEMRARLERLAPGQDVWVGTFHRFCARLLRQYAPLAGLEENFSIYDAEDSQRVLRGALADVALQLTHVPLERVADEISRAKNNLIVPDEFVPRPGHTLGALLQQVYPAYQRRLLASNAVDFDDLLLHVAVLLRENPELRSRLDERYRYLLVDEYQDTNFAQYAILRALSQDHPHLAVTGDPDQSIYGWRGASLDNILRFEHDFPSVRVVRLERNYRSTQRILRVADHLIANNARRKQKALYTENAEGPRVRLVVYSDSRGEAEDIVAQIARQITEGRRRARDFAVLYRTNWLSRPLEDAFRAAGVPYQVVRGLEFYQRKEVKDVLAYLQLIHNPRNDAALLRIINTPPRKIGKGTVKRLAACAAEWNTPLLEAARQAGLVPAIPKRAAVHVAAFVAQYDRMCLKAAAPLEELLREVLEETGYLLWLQASAAEDDRERCANVEELLNAAREFDELHAEENRLEVFLEQASLVSDTDDLETESDKVSLMTLHAAKGLEFPAVYIAALEQGRIPHERCRERPEEIEEERRLLFVGITRCREELQLSMARYRALRGSRWPTIPSQFLMELPRDEMEVVEPAPPPSPPDGDAELRAVDDDDRWKYEMEVTGDEEHRARRHARHARRARRDAAAARILTAAEMIGERRNSLPPISPEEFRLGMLVTHPEHGPGRIVALGGGGPHRTGTVQFFHPLRQVKFVLAHSNLEPMRAP